MTVTELLEQADSIIVADAEDLLDRLDLDHLTA